MMTRLGMYLALSLGLIGPAFAQVDDCLTRITCGTTIVDELEPRCFAQNAQWIHPFLSHSAPYKFYELPGQAGKHLRVTVTSSDFSPWATLTNPTNTQRNLGSSVDGVARITEGPLDRSGDWRIGVVGSGPSDFGSFTLELECADESLHPPLFPPPPPGPPPGPPSGPPAGPPSGPPGPPKPPAPPSAPFVCIEDGETLCLGENGRYEVKVQWRNRQPGSAPGRVSEIDRRDSGLFTFFDPENIEMLVKVLDACVISDRYWVYAAATTDVAFTLQVTDSQTGVVRQYFNPLGQAALPIRDIDAFATCP